MAEKENFPTPSTIKMFLMPSNNSLPFPSDGECLLEHSFHVTLVCVGVMCKVLKKYVTQRKTDVREYKASHLITPDMTLAWGRSNHIQVLRQLIQHLKVNPHVKISPLKACHICNYIMTVIVLGKVTRGSNIIEFSVEDFDTAYPSELPNAMKIFSERYKTSIIYGKKIIHVPLEIFDELQNIERHTRSNQGCFRRFGNSRILKTSQIWKVN